MKIEIQRTWRVDARRCASLILHNQVLLVLLVISTNIGWKRKNRLNDLALKSEGNLSTLREDMLIKSHWKDFNLFVGRKRRSASIGTYFIKIHPSRESAVITQIRIHLQRQRQCRNRIMLARHRARKILHCSRNVGVSSKISNR